MLVTTAGRGLKCGSSLRAASCQCGSACPSITPMPVLYSLIGTSWGISRTKVRLFDGLDSRTTTAPRRSASTVAESFALNRMTRLLSSPLNRSSTLPRKTRVWLAPDLSTSTPNSVPRSFTIAVGVRTENRGLEIRDWGFESSNFGFWILDPPDERRRASEVVGSLSSWERARLAVRSPCDPDSCPPAPDPFFSTRAVSLPSERKPPLMDSTS